MKLIIRIILIGVATFFLSPLLPWWTGMGAAMLICSLLPSSLLNAFIAGFLGMGLVWMGQAWVLDVANDSSFTTVIIELLQISVLDDPILVVLLTGLIGGLAGGLAGTSGASFRHLFQKKQQRGYYN